MLSQRRGAKADVSLTPADDEFTDEQAYLYERDLYRVVQ
jgi:hypothetical protein